MHIHRGYLPELFHKITTYLSELSWKVRLTPHKCWLAIPLGTGVLSWVLGAGVPYNRTKKEKSSLHPPTPRTYISVCSSPPHPPPPI